MSRKPILAMLAVAFLAANLFALSRQERIIAGSPSDSIEVRHLVLTGTNEEIGRALAEIGRERYGITLPPASDPARMRAERRFIKKNYPILYDRMRGVAAAFGRRIDDDSVDMTGLGFVELHAACSIIHFPAQATAMKTSVVSRDYDYSTGSISFGALTPGMLHPTARPYLLELHPDRGYASLAMVAYDLLCGVLDGINSEGLTVTMALDDEIFSKGGAEPTLGLAVGLGELQTLRLLLDTCATADEAKQALLQTKQYYAYVPVHYLIADRFGNSFVWEYSQVHNREYIIESPGQPLVMTNFTLSQHLDHDRPPSAEQARSVCKRYSFLTQQLAAAPGAMSEEIINATHKRVDAALPAAADPSRPPIRTFWHALYYPEQRRLKVDFYLHDEPLPGNAVRIVRSDYLEFKLAPTNQGHAPESRAVAAAAPAPARTEVAASNDETVAALKAGGATVKLDGARAVAVSLDKSADPLALLPLLRKLPNLTEVSAATPKMTDAGLAQLAGLPKLARLQLYSASISDDGLKAVETIPSLEYLGLRGNPITDAGLAHLSKLPNLKTLNISETKVTDDGLKLLVALPRLEVLMLAGDAITDAGLANLEPLTGITGLFVGETKITDAGLSHLKGMRRLTKLNIAKTAVTDAGLSQARSFFPFWINIQRE